MKGLIMYIQKFTKCKCLSYGVIVTVSCIASSSNEWLLFFYFRFIAQVERSALWQIQMFHGRSCRAKLQQFWAKSLKWRRSARLKPRRERPRYMGTCIHTCSQLLFSLYNWEGSCPAVGGLSKMMSLNVVRFKGVWYSHPIPEMKLMEREVERQQPLWFEEFLHPGNTAS